MNYKIKPEIANQLRSWDGNAGDRIDPVAQALRRLRLRVELCPCGGGLCLHCVEDLKSVERAWEASAPTTSPSTPSS